MGYDEQLGSVDSAPRRGPRRKNDYGGAGWSCTQQLTGYRGYAMHTEAAKKINQK